MESSQRSRRESGQFQGLRTTNGERKVNSFALVAYIRGPLGRFLDDLRRETVPDCVPRAHVTILPPRPVQGSALAAAEQIHNYLKGSHSFEVHATGVEVFENTSVIYIGLSCGRSELVRMHDALNADSLGFDEPHQYHPHITLAQGILPEQVAPLVELSKRRWAEYTGPRSFEVDSITFVQNTLENRWLDLAEYRLRAVPVL
mgnify:FL=1